MNEASVGSLQSHTRVRFSPISAYLSSQSGGERDHAPNRLLQEKEEEG